jgi:hypothetical protein
MPNQATIPAIASASQERTVEPEAATSNCLVRVNGHVVDREKPTDHVGGSGDSEVVFICRSCGEKAHPHEARMTSDEQWAENYFSYIPCTPGESSEL